MKRSLLSRVGALLAVLASSLGALVVVAPAASADPTHCVLWTASRACTVVTSAPAGGVQVLDRVSGEVVTWQNGTSVALDVWYTDSSGRCGVHGDSVVWVVNWRKPNNKGGTAYIGDYYLATGAVADWFNFTVNGEPLGKRFAGTGSGTCDKFPNG